MILARAGHRSIEATAKEVRSGPAGSSIAALFDLDRTLIPGYSAAAFLRERFRSGAMSAGEVRRVVCATVAFGLGRISFASFLSRTTASSRGIPESEFAALGEHVFETRLESTIHRDSRLLVEAHQEMGHTVAIVSSATPYQVDPVARSFGVSIVRCTHLVVEDGRFTGEVAHPVCYGEGKAQAGNALAELHGLDLGQSYFYTDSHEDLPLLEAVGRPRPVNPDRKLRATARRRGWPVHRFGSRQPSTDQRGDHPRRPRTGRKAVGPALA